MFSHEKLEVYRDLLHFVAYAEDVMADWDGRHCVTDHFSRALESSIVNLAEACRERSLSVKQTALDYSLGSILESAACADIALVKTFIDTRVAQEQKEELARIFGKLVGLRNSWEEQGVREDGSTYETGAAGSEHIFHHERLDVYQVALQILRNLTTSGILDQLPSRTFRRIDDTSTSMILNIAEGNGRYSNLDGMRFLNIANRATRKLAALIDVCVARGIWETRAVREIKQMLSRVDSMIAAMLKV